MTPYRLLVVSILTLATCLFANAQSSQTYNEFLKGVHERYDEFRNSIYENYAKFLEGEWVEIKVHKGEKKNEAPKPEYVPVALPEEIMAPPVVIFTPDAPPPLTIPVEVSVPSPSVTPHPVELNDGKTPENTIPIPATVTEPDSPPKPYKNPVDISQPQKPELEHEPMDEFDFYGMKLQVPQIELDIRNTISHKSEMAEQWRELDKKEGAGKLINEMATLRSRLGLNDYFTMQAILKYVASQYPNSNATSRLSLCHYVLTHLGYDVRFALTTSGIPMLMVPFQQKVYGRTFLLLDGKERYYLFGDNDSQPNIIEENIYTCEIPKNIDCGGKLNLRLEIPMNLPEKPYEFNVEYGGLKLQGKANANIYPLVYSYPQMEISEYAASQLMPNLRKELVSQLKTQLAGLPKEEAINKLLSLVQNGFDYATDQDQFGFEKAYFLEEAFFYPKCDCEDRAILYSYLLWNALDVENHIINYPGHEATAVNLEGNGDNYVYRGKCFQISDPTFIGAKTGRSMPRYKDVKPTIDFIYSN